MKVFGKVIEIQMINSSSGKFNGRVFVTFDSIKSASKAIKSLHKKKSEGKTISVELIKDDLSDEDEKVDSVHENDEF